MANWGTEGSEAQYSFKYNGGSLKVGKVRFYQNYCEIVELGDVFEFPNNRYNNPTATDWWKENNHYWYNDEHGNAVWGNDGNGEPYLFKQIDDNNYIGMRCGFSADGKTSGYIDMNAYSYDASAVTEYNKKGIVWQASNDILSVHSNILESLDYPLMNYIMLATRNDIIEENPTIYAIGFKQSRSPIYPYAIQDWVPSYYSLKLGHDEKIYSVSMHALHGYNTSNITVKDLEKDGSSSYTGGGTGAGSWDNSSDEIDYPSLPSINALSTGMIQLFKPSLSQVHALGSYLWSSDILDTLTKTWVDPLQLIISLNIIPVNLVAGASKEIKLAGTSTGVSANTLSHQFVSLDCGTVDVKEYFASALDYNPYTKISLYAPFVGIVPLNIDEVMDGAIGVQYNIDVLSGNFICDVKSIRANLSSVLYHFGGNMATNVPITQSNFSNAYLGAVQTAVGIAGAIATGGATLISSAGSLASNVMSSKVSVERSGNLNGNRGYMDHMKPYIIIERPIQSLANNYNHYNGYPSNITAQLGSLSGYTEIQSIIQSNINAHEDELSEIETLLKSGIYL